MLVKLEVVTAVPCKAKVLAVTVPLIAGSDAIVTLLEMDAVTEPIWAVPAPMVTEPAIVCMPVGLAVTVPEMAGREEMVTLLPTVTVPEMAGSEPISTVPCTGTDASPSKTDPSGVRISTLKVSLFPKTLLNPNTTESVICVVFPTVTLPRTPIVTVLRFEDDKFAVTVPLIAGREPMVTLLDMDAVTEPEMGCV